MVQACLVRIRVRGGVRNGFGVWDRVRVMVREVHARPLCMSGSTLGAGLTP